MRVRREAGIPAIDRRGPLPLGFRNDFLADDAAFFSVVLRPPPCIRIPGRAPIAQPNGETPGSHTTTVPRFRTIHIDGVPHGLLAPEI